MGGLRGPEIVGEQIMLLNITIKQIDNAYIMVTAGSSKGNGEKAYKNTEELALLEDLGFTLLGFKVKAERR